MKSKTFVVRLIRDGPMCAIPVPFDPAAVFGKSNREAAGLTGDETLEVRLDLDTEPREVEPHLAKALKAAPPAWDRWSEMSFSHKREYAESVESAKKPETRARRIEAAVKAVAARPPKKRRP